MSLHENDQTLLNLALERQLISRRQYQVVIAEMETGGGSGTAGRMMAARGFITPDQRIELENEVAGLGIESPATPAAAQPVDTGVPPAGLHPPEFTVGRDEWIVDVSQPFGVALLAARDSGAGDFQWDSGAVATVRVAGRLAPWTGPGISRRDVTDGLLAQLSPPSLKCLDRDGSCLVNAWLPDAWRVRISLMKTESLLSFAARFFPPTPMDPASLGIPPAARVGYGFSDGLFLIAGPQRSGRTTTLHAILGELMAAKPVHVVRVVRSVDYDLPPGKGAVTTLRVGRDTPSLLAGLGAAPGLAPRIVAIDDLITPEECLAALTLSEMGFLVLAVVSADYVPNAFGRFVEFGSIEDAPVLAQRVSERIRGILSQRLLPRADGAGLVLVPELLLAAPLAVAVLRSGRVNQVDAAIRAGRKQGMVHIDDLLMEMARAKAVELPVARMAAHNRQPFDAPQRPAGPSSPGTPPPSVAAPRR